MIDRYAITALAVAGCCLWSAGDEHLGGGLRARSSPTAQETQEPRSPAADLLQVLGYGPWAFGMSQEEVTAVAEHAPYEPVRASMGGVETRTAMFEPGVEKVSFVFNSSDELYDIRVWYHVGDSFEEAIAAFHRAYEHLSTTYGEISFNGERVLAPGLDLAALQALIPEQMAPEEGELDFEETIESRPELSLTPLRLLLTPAGRIHPAGQVAVAFLVMKPTTTRSVTAYYRGLRYFEGGGGGP